MDKFRAIPAKIYVYPNSNAPGPVKVVFNNPTPGEEGEANMIHFDSTQVTEQLFLAFLASFANQRPITVVYSGLHRNARGEVHAELHYVTFE